jgi:hypothetical protein
LTVSTAALAGVNLPEPVPYQCFISYSRADNDVYDGVVDRLKRELEGRFEAVTGSQLQVFLDRESIGWGEHWREKIAEAITGSTLFIPVVTMRYFNSDPCRDEFSAFHSAATQRGVSDLILPIILAGSDQITSEHPDELVRAVAELNWQPIFDEFDAGYESSTWKRRIGQLVTGLQAALARAATRLSDQAPEVVHPTSGHEPITEVDQETVMAHLQEVLTGLNEVLPLLERVAAAQNRFDGRDLSTMTDAQRTSLFNALADDIREPAAEFGAKASDVESKTRRLDAELRALVAEMYEIDPQQTREQLGQLREAIQAQSGPVQQFLDQMTQVEKVLRMAALTSTKLRTALRPMTAGLRSLGTTVRIYNSWESIGPSAG